MIWLASLGIAYGVTLMVVFPARTMRYPAWFWGTLIVNYFISVAALYLIPLPNDAMLQIGIAGALIGIVFTLLRAKFIEHEKRLGEKG